MEKSSAEVEESAHQMDYLVYAMLHIVAPPAIVCEIWCDHKFSKTSLQFAMTMNPSRIYLLFYWAIFLTKLKRMLSLVTSLGLVLRKIELLFIVNNIFLQEKCILLLELVVF